MKYLSSYATLPSERNGRLFFTFHAATYYTILINKQLFHIKCSRNICSSLSLISQGNGKFCLFLTAYLVLHFDKQNLPPCSHEFMSYFRQSNVNTTHVNFYFYFIHFQQNNNERITNKIPE